jgi:hypothetical protein
MNKQTYLHPEVELIEVLTERGFADSIEMVEKDEEVEF